MAEQAVMLAFQNNSDAKSVEVMVGGGEKIGDDDVTCAGTDINKPECEPEPEENGGGSASEGAPAVDDLMAGEDKTEFQDDLILENIDADSDAIEFKSDNVIVDCVDIEKMETDSEFFNREDEGSPLSPEDDVPPEQVIPDDKADAEDGPDAEVEDQCTVVPFPEVDNPTESLTKMQIMEDVREGCGIQPSSPGHAEERLQEHVSDNGFSEDTPVNGDPPEEIPDKKEPIEEKPEISPEIDKINNNSPNNNHVNNEESSSNASSEEAITGTNGNKRKFDSDDGADVNKRLRAEIQDNFISRDKLLGEFMELADCGSVEHLQGQSEQVLAEIRTLNELAREKEREWNNIIHLKKMKEELLLRMQRRKQILYLGDREVSDSELKSANQSLLKSNLASSKSKTGVDGKRQRSILPKPNNQYAVEMNGSLDYRLNKQRPVVDVQSIIADHRQRHPEAVPRRGRRIRNPQGEGKIMNFSSLALGSGSQVHQNNQAYEASSDLGILLNAIDTNCSTTESSVNPSAEPSFKDMLVQFAKLSQSERHELIQNAIKPPPPYPEVTVHPVPATNSTAPNNSLLHGILTKSPSKTSTKTSFSPTLARLLTAPERTNSNSPTNVTIQNHLNNAGNMSISEILSTSKVNARNEITITPVGNQYETTTVTKAKTGQEEEEAEDSADRLVIDESTEAIDARCRGDNNSDAGDEVPQCQGCHQKSALFVCAGCGNQWYCSRDCQVAAWDEHSEVCSG